MVREIEIFEGRVSNFFNKTFLMVLGWGARSQGLRQGLRL